MAKVVNIVETKIMKRNGVDVERVIFSNDKIVYVRLDNGEVYPEDTPDRYVDLISYYNAAHNGRAQRVQDSLNWASEHMDDFFGDTQKGETQHFKSEGFIKDGTGDRQAQIYKTKKKDYHKLSKNHRTQNAIDSIITFGQFLFFVGIFQIIVLAVLFFVIAGSSTPHMTEAESNAIIVSFFINAAISIVDMILGHGIKALDMSPGGIQAAAIFRIIIAIIALITSGAIGIMGIIVTIFAISVLAKIGTYKDWYYGEIE